MSFQIFLSPSAEKDLRKLERPVFLKIDRALLSLAQNPRPPNDKSLKDKKLAQFRTRVGDYRILYDVNSRDKIVYILRIGNRKDIYK